MQNIYLSRACCYGSYDTDEVNKEFKPSRITGGWRKGEIEKMYNEQTHRKSCMKDTGRISLSAGLTSVAFLSFFSSTLSKSVVCGWFGFLREKMPLSGLSSMTADISPVSLGLESTMMRQIEVINLIKWSGEKESVGPDSRLCPVLLGCALYVHAWANVSEASIR